MPPFNAQSDPINKPYDNSWWYPQFGPGSTTPAPPSNAQTPVNQRGQLSKVIAGYRQRGGFNSLDQNKAIQGEHVGATPGKIDLSKLRDYANTISGWGNTLGYTGATAVAGAFAPPAGALMAAAPKVAKAVDWGLGQLGFGGGPAGGGLDSSGQNRSATGGVGSADQNAGNSGGGYSGGSNSPGSGPDDVGGTPGGIGRDPGSYGGGSGPSGGGTSAGSESAADHDAGGAGGGDSSGGGGTDSGEHSHVGGRDFARGGMVPRTALGTVNARRPGNALQDLQQRSSGMGGFSRGGMVPQMQVSQPRQSPSTAMPTPGGLGNVQARRITGVPRRYAEGGTVAAPIAPPAAQMQPTGGPMNAGEMNMPAPSYGAASEPTGGFQQRMAQGGQVPNAPTDPLVDASGASTGQAVPAGDPSIANDGIVDNQSINADEGEFVVQSEAAQILGPDVLELINDPASAELIRNVILAMIGSGGSDTQQGFQDEEGGLPVGGDQPQQQVQDDRQQGAY